jgi:hypothetical protein
MPGPLITHLQTHHEEYTDFLNAKQKLEEPPKVTANQKSIRYHWMQRKIFIRNFQIGLWMMQCL